MAKSRKKGKDKQPKTSLMTKLATELEVPSEILPGVFRIELQETREATVDGCKGILEYKDERIKLKLSNKTVTFAGLNLEIKTFTNERVIISGYIAGIDFSE